MTRIGYEIEMLITMRNGVLKAVQVIESSYGPNGKNVACQIPGNHLITKDGLEILKQISLRDPIENAGVRMMEAIAQEIDDNFNDGGSTAILLASSLIYGGIHAIASGISPYDLNKGIQKAHFQIEKILKRHAKAVPKELWLKSLLNFHYGDDKKLHNFVGIIFRTLGHHTCIKVVESPDGVSRLVHVKGIKFKNKNLSADTWGPGYIKRKVKGAKILIVDGPIDKPSEIHTLIAETKTLELSLVLIASSFSPDTLLFLNRNNKSNGKSLIALVPSCDDGKVLTNFYTDLALVMKTSVIVPKEGVQVFNTLSCSDLGLCKEIQIGLKETFILPIDDPKKIRRITRVTKKLRQEWTNALKIKEKYQIEQRLSILEASHVEMVLGGSNEIKVKENVRRAKEGIRRIKMGSDEGMLRGGLILWSNLYQILETFAEKLPENEKRGVQVYRKMLLGPFQALSKNQGMEPYPLLERMNGIVLESHATLDIRNFDVLQKEVYSPVKMMRVILGTVVSAVSELLVSQVIIVK